MTNKINEIKKQIINGKDILELGSMELYMLANVATFEEEFDLNNEENNKVLDDVLNGKIDVYEAFGPLDTTLEEETDGLRYTFKQ